MTCPVCAYPLIPGIGSCVQCGEPCEAGEGEGNLPVASDSQVAGWIAENAAARALSRKLTEARALEHATDTAGAIAIYEGLVREGSVYSLAYRRLAIIYRKMKDYPAEERVVRAALGRLTVNGWFIVRLAKILAERRATSATESPSG